MIVTLTPDDKRTDPAVLAARMIEQGHAITQIREQGHHTQRVRVVWRAEQSARTAAA